MFHFNDFSISILALLPVSAPSAPASFLGAVQTQSIPATVPPITTDMLKSDPSPPPLTGAASAAPVMMWNSPTNSSPSSSADIMMPPPTNLTPNSLMNRRPSNSMQLILPDNLKTEVIDENSSNSLLNENSMSGMSTSGPITSPLEHLVNENSRDASQSSMISNVVQTTESPVQEALLGVVDLIRNQHSINMVSQQNSFNGLHESPQVLSI